MRLEGSYTSVYDLSIVINGNLIDRVHTLDTGMESGKWYYDLEALNYDGPIEVVVIGSDSATRYGVWSPMITLDADYSKVSKPQVEIINPKDKEIVNADTTVQIQALGKNDIKKVEVRINGGAWKTAAGEGKLYEMKWNTRPLGERVSSIEARATDVYGNVGRSLTTYVSTQGTEKPAQSVQKQDRAMWIWESESYPLVMNPRSRTVLHAMATDTSTFGQDPITTLYLGVDKFEGTDMLEDERGKVRDFVKWAHKEGFRVQALIAGGTRPPYFGAYERYREPALREFEKVLNYNLSSDPKERFDGVNVDVEPYIAADFKTDTPSVQIQYLDYLETILERRDASGLDLPVGPAIPRWYDTSDNTKAIPWKGVTKPLSQHIQDIADYIAIMDYRDQAEGSVGIIDQARDELEYANAIEKNNSVVIGVETKDIADGGDPEMISFQEEGRTFMEAELDKVYAAFEENPAFAGIALHHYEDLQKLPTEWGPEAVSWQAPADQIPPGAVKGTPQASAFNFQTVDLSYGPATDNREVDEYRIYRGTEPDFPADEAHLAGTSRGLSYTDKGLLPETTYYYKVAAVDSSGNIGKASKTTSATTGITTLKPLVIDKMEIVYEQSRAKATLLASYWNTGETVAVTVHGRFTFKGGKYVDVATDESGVATALSEGLAYESGKVGFLPKRLTAEGYYWASAYDRVKAAETEWSSSNE
ncbi:hypothetical protein GCM10010911_47380 [Paenibacillus nasutitermitis]|uniref:Fibronectin type-III domain-containing protein n=1 Tax=Paenibacillus nasutitermitis TaxID=1652958 RepID=A0A917DZ32_9BACL|nr:hypothetical protein GCM10010911_47380 [Paenibacillus nasutitermitis]